MRNLALAGELNGSTVWCTDIGNTHLEIHTKEKVHIVVGPEFSDWEGRMLIVSKALRGLHSSGLRWSERSADTLRAMGLFPSNAEKDVWMPDKSNLCEHMQLQWASLMQQSCQAKINKDEAKCMSQ